MMPFQASLVWPDFTLLCTREKGVLVPPDFGEALYMCMYIAFRRGVVFKSMGCIHFVQNFSVSTNPSKTACWNYRSIIGKRVRHYQGCTNLS